LLSRSYGYETSFEHFVDLTPGEKDPWLRSVKGGHHLLKQPVTHAISGMMGVRTRPAKIYSPASEITEQICKWIEGTKEPFFIWGHYMDVHWPYHLEDSLTQPSQIAQAWRDVIHLHDANWNGAEITPQQRAHYIELYEQAIADTDRQLGRLFSFLVDQGLDRDTMIVLVSDHGEELLEHGRWGHWEDNLYDEILKVPLIIHLPDGNKELVIDDQVSTLDLMPTVLELSGCPSPSGMKGSSLVPLWDANAGKFQPRIAIGEMWRDAWHIIAVRSDKYKYIWDNRQPERPWLFDLNADPEEKENLASQNPRVVSKLHVHVDEVLSEMERTMSDKIETPELDEEMLGRLRDLGYVQ
jgi:arylsulfatase A-like enzyme